MGAAREKVQADFDLERFVEMFDEALTSNDERVVNALRSLMMMVILTKPEASDTTVTSRKGPLRQMIEDIHYINNRLHTAEEELSRIKRQLEPMYRREVAEQTAWTGFEKSPAPSPYTMSADKAQAAGMYISKEFAQKVNGGLIKPTTKEGI